MTPPTDPRAVAAAEAITAGLRMEAERGPQRPLTQENIEALIAAEYAPLVEAARRAMRYFDEQESDDVGTTEMRWTVLVALREAFGGGA